MAGPWQSVDDQKRAIVRSARRAGSRVLSLGEIQTPVGRYASARLECPDGWAGARLLVLLADEDARTSGGRAEALAMRQRARSDAAFARAVFDRVQALQFLPERGEVFTAASYTLDVGAGDCDDEARLVYALLRAGGLPARLVFLSRGGEPTHAVAQVRLGQAWQWLETTIPARFGEHPMSAKTRLGHGARTDIGVHATAIDPFTLEKTPVLGFLLGAAVAVQTTGDLSSQFFRDAALMARRANLRGASVSGLDFLSVFNGESGVYANKSGPNSDGLYDYGLNMMHGPATLRFAGWLGTPDQYLSLSADEQLPYVERYFQKMIPPSAWRYVRGARQLYAINAWPGIFASNPMLFLDDEAVIASKGHGAYYSGFDFHRDGTNRPSDIDTWIAAQQKNAGARWTEIAARYGAESGDVPIRPLDALGVAKTAAFLGIAGGVAAWLVRDA